MRPLVLFSALAASLFAHDAMALTLNLDQVSGSWSNAVGAPDTTTYVTVGDEVQVLWGGDIGFGQSGLGFTGLATLPYTIVPDQEFVLGTMRHFNNPVLAPALTNVDLGLSLHFQGVTDSKAFTFPFQIDETTNEEPCPYPGTTPCADRLAFPPGTGATFDVGGTTVILEIVGFRTALTAPTLTEWISEESSTNTALLIARVRFIAPQGGGCTYTQGYWKNHAKWPISTLALGNRAYTQQELLSILGQPVRGNGLVALAHQLIAAKLNVANGAGAPSDVQAAITAADALIGDLVAPPVGSGWLATSATSALTGQLDAFNSGLSQGVPHCN